GEKILAACKKKNVGTVAMKTAPGVLEVVPVDPEKLTPDQEEMVDRLKGFGMDREAAIERLRQGITQDEENCAKTKPFAEKYKIKTREQLHKASIQWVLKNPDIHTVCVSFGNFDLVDQIVPISGKELSQASTEFLREYTRSFNHQYCRHGCSECAGHCPRGLPVSTIMRYAYYFECQGREKEAMAKYHGLKGLDAAQCCACEAPCARACPHQLNIRSHLLRAHSLLTLV
ncbi:MAG: hypothetical protein ABIK28_13795, partial [Planctomycetota bacterium]